MQLNDNLQVCLLALTSRYPEHILDINEGLLGTLGFDADGWTALDLIEVLEQTSPDLLLASARLIVDPQKSEIYLLAHSERVPALFVHCRGKVPICKGSISLRQALYKRRSNRAQHVPTG